jgi:hypothetical protein
MTIFRLSPASLQRCLPAILILLGLAACESDRHRPDGPPPAGTAGPAAEVAIPEMETHGTFFTGQIELETLLNRGGFTERGGGGGDDSATGGGGGRGGRGSGNGRGGGGGRGRGAGSGTYGTGAGGADGNEDAAPRILPVNLPAVRLHLRLTNHGVAPIEVEVTDFDSDLGNFVVEPEKMLLPPNVSVEAEPMTSRLGVSAEAIPLTVTLRTGTQVETQVLTLRMIKPPAPPTPAAGAPSTPPP